MKRTGSFKEVDEASFGIHEFTMGMSFCIDELPDWVESCAAFHQLSRSKTEHSSWIRYLGPYPVEKGE